MGGFSRQLQHEPDDLTLTLRLIKCGRWAHTERIAVKVTPVVIPADVVASPADFEIDFGSGSAVAQQIDTLLLTAPTSTWTIAVVETNNGGHSTTDASFQFNFLGLKAVNGALTPTLKAATQLGVMNQ